MEQYRQENPDVGEKEIHVDVTVAPTPKAPGMLMNPIYVANINDHHHGRPMYRNIPANRVHYPQLQGMQNPAVDVPGEQRP
jgi:hypothetical protein